MFDVDGFLDRAKLAAGVTSDYALGVKVLGYPKSTTVTNWRSGRSMPDARAIIKLCALTGDDPEHVAACIQAMRSANDEEAELWQRVADRLRQSGAASIAFAVVTAALFVAGVVHTSDTAAASLPSAYYVKCAVGFALARLAWRMRTFGLRTSPTPAL